MLVMTQIRIFKFVFFITITMNVFFPRGNYNVTELLVKCVQFKPINAI